MLLILALKELDGGWVMVGSEINHVSVGQNPSPQCQQLSVLAKMLQINTLAQFGIYYENYTPPLPLGKLIGKFKHSRNSTWLKFVIDYSTAFLNKHLH